MSRIPSSVTSKEDDSRHPKDINVQGRGELTPANKPNVQPAFQPFLYTLDLLLPVVSLHVRDAWIAHGPRRCGVWSSSGHKFAGGAGSSGSAMSETDLAMKQVQECCEHVLRHVRKQFLKKAIGKMRAKQ